MSFDIIDLSWVREAKDEDDSQTYLCPLCTPDGILHKVSDPKKLEFVGAGVIRYECLSCGYLIDNTDSRIRRQEKGTTILGDNNNKPNAPVLETVKSNRKDKLKGTTLGQFNEFSFDLDPTELQELTHQGFQLKEETTKSSVSGHRVIRQGKRKSKQRSIVER